MRDLLVDARGRLFRGSGSGVKRKAWSLPLFLKAGVLEMVGSALANSLDLVKGGMLIG